MPRHTQYGAGGVTRAETVSREKYESDGQGAQQGTLEDQEQEQYEAEQKQRAVLPQGIRLTEHALVLLLRNREVFCLL